jgi:hypothetical protein
MNQSNSIRSRFRPEVRRGERNHNRLSNCNKEGGLRDAVASARPAKSPRVVAGLVAVFSRDGFPQFAAPRFVTQRFGPAAGPIYSRAFFE